MYQYDIDNSEGRWSVEKHSYMAAELYKQVLLDNNMKVIHMNLNTASAFTMGMFPGWVPNTKEDYPKTKKFGTFCGIDVYHDQFMPDYAWEFRLLAESVLV